MCDLSRGDVEREQNSPSSMFMHIPQTVSLIFKAETKENLIREKILYSISDASMPGSMSIDLVLNIL